MSFCLACHRRTERKLCLPTPRTSFGGIVSGFRLFCPNDISCRARRTASPNSRRLYAVLRLERLAGESGEVRRTACGCDGPVSWGISDRCVYCISVWSVLESTNQKAGDGSVISLCRRSRSAIGIPPEAVLFLLVHNNLLRSVDVEKERSPCPRHRNWRSVAVHLS